MDYDMSAPPTKEIDVRAFRKKEKPLNDLFLAAIVRRDQVYNFLWRHNMKAFSNAVLAVFLLLVPALALAQASLPSVDGGAAAQGAFDALKSHSWMLLAAYGVMLLVWTVGKFGLLNKLPSKYVPYLAIIAGSTVGIASGIVAHLPWFQAVSAGLQIGLSAIGAWETGGKRIDAVLAKPS